MSSKVASVGHIEKSAILHRNIGKTENTQEATSEVLLSVHHTRGHQLLRRVLRLIRITLTPTILPGTVPMEDEKSVKARVEGTVYSVQRNRRIDRRRFETVRLESGRP